MNPLQTLFELRARNTNPMRELRGAIATFLTMAYILAANPLILASAGIPTEPAIACTALAAGVSCLIMGFYANFPIALASGMGINAYIASLAATGQMTWQTAMGLVVLDGIVILLLVLVGIREAVMRAIPKDLRLAIGAGIGFLIALIGLVNARLVVVPALSIQILSQSPAATLPPVTSGDLRQPAVLVFVAGFLLTALLFARKVTGSLVIGIVATTALSIVVGASTLPSTYALPSLDLLSLVGQADIRSALKFSYIPLLLAIMMVDFFDTLGTATAVADEAGLMDESGNIPRLKQLLVSDSLGAAIGGFCGVSSVTSYIESAAGVAEGARTGLHTVFVGILFLACVFLAPFVAIIPAAATAPALVLVGFLMIAHMKNINVNDWEAAIPAFVIFLTIPLTYSIAHGIAFGFVTYTVIKVFTGKYRQVHPMFYAATAMLAIYLALPAK